MHCWFCCRNAHTHQKWVSLSGDTAYRWDKIPLSSQNQCFTAKVNTWLCSRYFWIVFLYIQWVKKGKSVGLGWEIFHIHAFNLINFMLHGSFHRVECCRMKGFKKPMPWQTPTSLLLVHFYNISGLCALFLEIVELGYKNALTSLFYLLITTLIKIVCPPDHQKSKEKIGGSLWNYQLEKTLRSVFPYCINTLQNYLSQNSMETKSIYKDFRKEIRQVHGR